MESFSILALNRPLRWLGSDTWEALSNSFALNIWHTCRKTKESCCCRGWWSISFQFPIAFVSIYFYFYSFVRCNDLLVRPGVSRNPLAPYMPSGW